MSAVFRIRYLEVVRPRVQNMNALDSPRTTDDRELISQNFPGARNSFMIANDSWLGELETRSYVADRGAGASRRFRD